MSGYQDDAPELLVRTPADVGGAIRFFRRRAGLSQESLAEAAGLYRSYLGSIERGERRTFAEALMRVLRRLDLEVVIRRRGPGDGGA